MEEQDDYYSAGGKLLWDIEIPGISIKLISAYKRPHSPPPPLSLLATALIHMC